MSEIVNKVAQSGLITIDLEDFISDSSFVIIDLKEQLWQGIVLREKDFRDWIKTYDWSIYKDELVGITCSVDAIIPQWAYVLVSSSLAGIAQRIEIGEIREIKNQFLLFHIDLINASDYENARVIIKGCSKDSLPLTAYARIIEKLHPVVRSLMYGEPCSTVPIYKRP